MLLAIVLRFPQLAETLAHFRFDGGGKNSSRTFHTASMSSFSPSKTDLPARLVLPALKIACHVHPADHLLAAQLVRLADDEIHVHRLADPVCKVAVVLHVEDLAAVAFAGAQVGNEVSRSLSALNNQRQFPLLS